MRYSHAVSDRSRGALDCQGLCRNRTWDHRVHHYLALGELEHGRERWRVALAVLISARRGSFLDTMLPAISTRSSLCVLSRDSIQRALLRHARGSSMILRRLAIQHVGEPTMQPGFESRWKFHWCLASNTEMESRKRYSAASFITRCCILPRLRWKFQRPRS